MEGRNNDTPRNCGVDSLTPCRCHLSGPFLSSCVFSEQADFPKKVSPASTGYGYVVCTIGVAGYDAAMFPIHEELCDFIIYTHVYFDRIATVVKSTTGYVSYDKFKEPQLSPAPFLFPRQPPLLKGQTS
ncbi:hypothetical protein HPB52_022183 [Rhipicephalus sanguineus]|uniref:Uncharacterized protein n=1 Tax=Rhipicephalus sanguineus TaxID=34632 RepID=A0A9D4PSV7_RHISA|nr:hypothetical protein HPB52_022183 [Rhipicephalus sanguineus]